MKIRSGGDDSVQYTAVTGLNVQEEPDSEPSDIDGEESDTSEEDGDSCQGGFVNSHRPREESPESKKARKKAVKEAQAEKRKVKVKKHVKKRKEQAGRRAMKK